MPRARRWAEAAPGRCRAPAAPRCPPRDGAAPEGGCGGPRPPPRPPRLRQWGPGGVLGARGPPQPAGGTERGRPGAAAPAAGSAAPPRLASLCPSGCSPAAAAARRGELAERGERLGKAAGCVGWGFVGTKTCGSGECAWMRCGPVGFPLSLAPGSGAGSLSGGVSPRTGADRCRQRRSPAGVWRRARGGRGCLARWWGKEERWQCGEYGENAFAVQPRGRVPPPPCDFRAAFTFLSGAVEAVRGQRSRSRCFPATPPPAAGAGPSSAPGPATWPRVPGTSPVPRAAGEAQQPARSTCGF